MAQLTLSQKTWMPSLAGSLSIHQVIIRADDVSSSYVFVAAQEDYEVKLAAVSRPSELNVNFSLLPLFSRHDTNYFFFPSKYWSFYPAAAAWNRSQESDKKTAVAGRWWIAPGGRFTAVLKVEAGERHLIIIIIRAELWPASIKE